jgi:hypothetical protein
MKNSLVKFGICGLLAIAVVGAPLCGFAQENKDKAPIEKKEGGGEKKKGGTPFRGKLAAADKAAKTITVGERTFQITSDTRIMKAGKPATLDDAVVGEDVGGSYDKGEGDKLVAKMVRFGPRPEGEGKKGEGKEKKKE